MTPRDRLSKVGANVVLLGSVARSPSAEPSRVETGCPSANPSGVRTLRSAAKAAGGRSPGGVSGLRWRLRPGDHPTPATGQR